MQNTRHTGNTHNKLTKTKGKTQTYIHKTGQANKHQVRVIRVGQAITEGRPEGSAKPD